jgi:predicted short-subunit dehydrogenase-like oxidoreductase (DUF2520 family)
MPQRVAIVGAGRVGLSLARALIRSSIAVRVLGRSARSLPDPLPSVEAEWAAAIAASDLVLVAVPDDAIGAVAAKLAATAAITVQHTVLHTSGLHDRSVLSALDASGAALGSWHPLQTFGLIDGDPAALTGTPAVIEGDARAIDAGRGLARVLHLRPIVEIPATSKATYHAAAVFASNYLVVLGEIAARLGRAAGAGDTSAEIFIPLMRRTMANYATGGAATLTGPIRRGDAGTVAQHLAALSGAERELYIGLGREALRLARADGVDPAKADAIEGLLTAW